MWKPEPHRPHDVGCVSQESFTFGKSFANQAELIMFKISQAAVNQFAAAGGGCGCEIIHLAEQYSKTSASRIESNAGAIYSASNHQYVEQILTVCHFSISQDEC
tara:strand:- start:37789 stop:38100 length:312 start_codon:yes stop_codon:yes gene_type:complete